MKIYLLTQNINTGYDTYDSCIVCANSVADAKTITADGEVLEYHRTNMWSSWTGNIKDIKCKEIGVANKSQKRGLILASFNAG